VVTQSTQSPLEAREPGPGRRPCVAAHWRPSNGVVGASIPRG